MNLYNERAPYPAQWLRNLSQTELINPGRVNEEDIRNLQPSTLRGVTQFHAFAGLGAWSYALRLAGWPDDAEVWTGSCPCQPFSTAGARGGTADSRHLWPAWRGLIAECQPPVIFGEQVASPAGRRWLSVVQTDLEELGYRVASADLCAAGVGAPHRRQRLWFCAFRMADDDDDRRQSITATRLHEARTRGHHTYRRGGYGVWRTAEWIDCTDGKSRPVEPGTLPLVNGATGRVEQLRAYGNAIVPQIAAAFIVAAVTANEQFTERT